MVTEKLEGIVVVMGWYENNFMGTALETVMRVVPHTCTSSLQPLADSQS